MSSSNMFTSDLNKIYGLISTSMIVYPKEIIISTLKDYFSRDSYFHFVKDEWGFPKIIDHTNLELNAGIADDAVSRIYIGEQFKQDVVFYPSILVKNTGFKSIPISLNRNYGKYIKEDRTFTDGYGNSIVFKNPSKFILNGVFETSFSLDISAKSIRERDDLVELASMSLIEIFYEDLSDIDITVTNVAGSAPSETDDRGSKIYKQSINFNVIFCWTRQIPIANVIESILFSIIITNTDDSNYTPSPNLKITTKFSLEDKLLSLI